MNGRPNVSGIDGAAMMRLAVNAMLAIGLVIGSVGVAASIETTPQRPLDTRVIQSGHSLTDPIPAVLEKMIRASGGPDTVMARSTIPGSPMEFRWRNPPDPSLPDARARIGDFEVLVLTERVSLSNTLPWHNSPDEALRWFNHAWKNGNGGKAAETVLYATWVSIDSGPDYENPYQDPEGHIPWRERLPLEFARWIEILDHVNTKRPKGSSPMQIIPGPLIFAAVHDEIAAGTAHHLSDISDLFSDHIHLNDAGAYLIALAHFAVIYGRDPRELPENAGKPETLHPETAEWMRDLVWRVLTDYDAAILTE